MRIRGKLLSMSLFMMAGYIAITGITYSSVTQTHQLNALARKGSAVKAEFLSFMLASKDLVVTTNLGNSLTEWRKQAEVFKKSYEDFAGSKELRAVPGAVEKVKQFNFLWETTQKQIDDLSTKIEALVQKNSQGGSQFVVGLLQGFDKYGDMDFISPLSKIGTLSASLTTYALPAISDIVNMVSAEAGKQENALIIFIVGLAIGVMAVSFVIFMLFARHLVRRLQKVGDSMETLKRKDFSVRLTIEGKDELRGIVDAVNGFVDDFSKVISGVKGLSTEVAAIKNEAASATVESAAAVTEMTASITSIAAKIRQLVENLGRSNQAVRGISASIDALMTRIDGQSALIGRTIESIEQMNSSTGNVALIAGKRETSSRELVATTKAGGAKIDETNAMVHEIVRDIQEIAGIVSIIDDISSRTNLLSMNAAIEAAHAGNAGKGFSIVAEEIRKLADSTNENSTRIKKMTDGISRKIDEVLAKSESSKVAFIAVDKEVDSTSLAMSEIAAVMHDLSQGSGEIMAVTKELSAIAAQVSAEAQGMRTNTMAVLEGIKNIEEISTIVEDGMLEMETATRDINSAMVHVTELQMQSGESIERLNGEVSVFKTVQAPISDSATSAEEIEVL
ncbi:MAG TPA: methyl-accepting chemotaxis protein [Rectinemataceae bacterium]|nr:methyl-accepting chemotaxis protein [Rectinemataceae bacterium]